RPGNWLHCNWGTPVTVSAEPSATPATCDVDGTLVLPQQEGIAWTGGTNGAGPGTYTIVATAAEGYVLTAPYSKTVTVAAATGDCAPPPPTCLDPDRVSYTYSNTLNKGVVTV